MANIGFNTALSNMANSVFGYSRTSDRNFGSGTASMNSSIDSYLGGGGNSLSSMFGGYTPAHRGGLFGSSNDIIGKLVGSIPTPQTIDYSAAFLQGGALFGGGGQIAATGSQQQGKIGCHEIPRAGGNGTDVDASDDGDAFGPDGASKKKGQNELSEDHVEDAVAALMTKGLSESEARAIVAQAENAAGDSKTKFDDIVRSYDAVPARAPTEKQLEAAGDPAEKAKLAEKMEAEWQAAYGKWYAKNVGGLTDRQAEEFVKREMFGVADTVKGTREADVKRSPYPGKGLFRYADGDGNNFFYSKSQNAWFNDKDGKEPINVSVKSGVKPNPTAKGGNPLKIVVEGGDEVAKDDALQIARTGLQEANGKLYDSFKISEASGEKATAILAKAGEQDILHDSATNSWFTWDRNNEHPPVEMAPPPIGRSPNGQFLVFAEAKRNRPLYDGVGLSDIRKKVDVSLEHFKADLQRVADENTASRKDRIDSFEKSWKSLPEDVRSAVEYKREGDELSFTADEAGAAKLSTWLKDKENCKDFNYAFSKVPGDVSVKFNGAAIRLTNGATGEFKWRIGQMSPKAGANDPGSTSSGNVRETDSTVVAPEREPSEETKRNNRVELNATELTSLTAEGAKAELVKAIKDGMREKVIVGDLYSIDLGKIALGKGSKITKADFDKMVGDIAKEFGANPKNVKFKIEGKFKGEGVAKKKTTPSKDAESKSAKPSTPQEQIDVNTLKYPWDEYSEEKQASILPTSIQKEGTTS